MTRTDRGPTARFCESWPVQAVHTSPVFQALNNTVLDSFFFSPYTATASFWLWHWITFSNKTQTLASLSQSRSELSASLSLSLHLSSLPVCLFPLSSSATTSLTQIALASLFQSLSTSLSLSLHLCLFPSSPLATTDLSLRSFKHLHRQWVPIGFYIYTYRLLLVKIRSNALFGWVESWWKWKKLGFYFYLYFYFSFFSYLRELKNELVNVNFSSTIYRAQIKFEFFFFF